jgi:hypothetical protein
MGGIQPLPQPLSSCHPEQSEGSVTTTTGPGGPGLASETWGGTNLHQGFTPNNNDRVPHPSRALCGMGGIQPLPQPLLSCHPEQSEGSVTTTAQCRGRNPTAQSPIYAPSTPESLPVQPTKSPFAARGTKRHNSTQMEVAQNKRFPTNFSRPVPFTLNCSTWNNLHRLVAKRGPSSREGFYRRMERYWLSCDNGGQYCSSGEFPWLAHR